MSWEQPLCLDRLQSKTHKCIPGGSEKGFDNNQLPSLCQTKNVFCYHLWGLYPKPEPTREVINSLETWTAPTHYRVSLNDSIVCYGHTVTPIGSNESFLNNPSSKYLGQKYVIFGGVTRRSGSSELEEDPLSEDGLHNSANVPLTMHTAFAYNSILQFSYLSAEGIAPVNLRGEAVKDLRRSMDRRLMVPTGYDETVRRSHKLADRWKHAAVGLPNGTTVVIFGVTGKHKRRVCNDILTIHPDGQIVEESTVGTTVPGRYGHTATLHNGKIYVIGGLEQSGDCAERVMVLDVSETPYRWHRAAVVEGRSSNLGTRYCHTADLIGDNIILFGGADGSGIQRNDVVEFSLNKYTFKKCPMASSVLPARMSHCSCVLGNCIVIVGGYSSTTDQQIDVSVLDTVTREWSIFSAKNDCKTIYLNMMDVMCSDSLRRVDAKAIPIDPSRVLVLGGAPAPNKKGETKRSSQDAFLMPPAVLLTLQPTFKILTPSTRSYVGLIKQLLIGGPAPPDLEFVIGSGDEKSTFVAHKAIVYARCKKLKSIVTQNIPAASSVDLLEDSDDFSESESADETGSEGGEGSLSDGEEKGRIMVARNEINVTTMMETSLGAGCPEARVAFKIVLHWIYTEEILWDELDQSPECATAAVRLAKYLDISALPAMLDMQVLEPPSLANDLATLFSSCSSLTRAGILGTDVEFVLSGDDDAGIEGCSVFAHRCVLAAASRYFEGMFRPGVMKEGGRGHSRVFVRGECNDPAVFRDFISYLYGKKADDFLHEGNAFMMLHLASFYCVEDLRSDTESFISRRISKSYLKNVASGCLALSGGAADRLLNFCFETAHALTHCQSFKFADFVKGMEHLIPAQCIPTFDKMVEVLYPLRNKFGRLSVGELGHVICQSSAVFPKFVGSVEDVNAVMFILGMASTLFDRCADANAHQFSPARHLGNEGASRAGIHVGEDVNIPFGAQLPKNVSGVYSQIGYETSLLLMMIRIPELKAMSDIDFATPPPSLVSKRATRALQYMIDKEPRLKAVMRPGNFKYRCHCGQPYDFCSAEEDNEHLQLHGPDRYPFEWDVEYMMNRRGIHKVALSMTSKDFLKVFTRRLSLHLHHTHHEEMVEEDASIISDDSSIDDKGMSPPVPYPLSSRVSTGSVKSSGSRRRRKSSE